MLSIDRELAGCAAKGHGQLHGLNIDGHIRKTASVIGQDLLSARRKSDQSVDGDIIDVDPSQILAAHQR